MFSQTVYRPVEDFSCLFSRFIYKFSLFLFVVMLSFSTASVAQSYKDGLQPVALSLKWTHQFQFAGYYMAKEKGYYEQAGLDVSFLDADPAINSVQRVLKGDAQFGIGTTELLHNAEVGDSIAILGVIFQHSPVGIVTINPDIQTLDDLRGRKVMIEENSAELFALLKQAGINRSDLIIHRHTFDVEDLLNGKIDAMSVYKTTELADLQMKGIDYKAFYPIDAGIDFYGDNLFTTQDIVKNNLELVEAFRQASFRGWQYAVEHKEETVRHILSTYVTERTYEQLLFEANAMDALLQHDRIYPGNMTQAHWQKIANTYLDLNFLNTQPNFAALLYEPEVKLEEIKRRLIMISTILFFVIAILFVSFYFTRRLMRSKSEYQSFFSDAPLSVVVLDKNYYILQWNKQAEQTFGWTAEETIGRNVLDFLVSKKTKVLYAIICVKSFAKKNAFN